MPGHEIRERRDRATPKTGEQRTGGAKLKRGHLADGRQPFPYPITEELPVIRPNRLGSGGGAIPTSGLLARFAVLTGL